MPILALLTTSPAFAQRETFWAQNIVTTSTTPTLVSITVGFKGGSTASATLNIGTATAGNVVWAAVGTDPSGAGGSLAITDNCNTAGSSNTYTQLTNSPLIGNANVFAIYAWSTIGATTANCTLTFTETTTTGDFSMAAGTVSGGTTVEQSQFNVQTSPGTGANGITSNSTSATSHADLVIGFYVNVFNGGAAIPTAGTGYVINTTGVNGPVATESLTQSSSGVATATFTTTTAGTQGGGFTGVICFH